MSARCWTVPSEAPVLLATVAGASSKKSGCIVAIAGGGVEGRPVHGRVSGLGRRLACGAGSGGTNQDHAVVDRDGVRPAFAR